MGLAWLALVAYAVAVATGLVDDFPALWRVLAVAGSLVAAAICLLTARSAGHVPAIPLALAAGMACWGAGFTVYFLSYEDRASVPVPGVTDALWLGWYVATLLGLWLMARRVLTGRVRVVWPHVLIGTSTLAALMGAILLEPILGAGASDLKLILTALAYLAMDLLLMALTISVMAASGWRISPRWALIAIALVVQVIGGTVYGWQLSHGTWKWGTTLELTWPVVQLLLAVAIRMPESWIPGPRTAQTHTGLGMPLAFAAVSAGLLVYGNFAHPPAVVVVLSVVALGVSAVLIANAVRELHLLRAEVRVDPLTGLANHSHFHDSLAAEVAAAQERNGELVLLLGDLDGFKGVNDRFGHAQGDAALQQTASVLRECFGRHLIGRLGGDEFGVLLAGTGLAEALPLAERAADRVASLTDGLGISWGAATFPSDGPSPQLLLVRADLALYDAKRTVAGSGRRPQVAADEAQRRQLEAYARDVRAGYARERRKARDLNDSYMATVLALAAGIEAKDDATGGHIQRVRAIGLLLAEVVCPGDLDDPQLAYGFLLHDIGKLAIPDAVLTKPGKLDEDEWALMRTHPEAGIRILSPVPFLRRALDVVGHHHERWDGTGYPDGLAGEEIPLWARAFAVADTVDAMTADRPYRKGLPFETALQEVLSQSGRQFDPACAQALASLPRERIRPLLEDHRSDNQLVSA